MGRTVGQQWYGGTEGNPWDSLHSLPGLRGWVGLWDTNGMVGLGGMGRTVGQQWYGGTEGSP